jgi:hypothetical protein
MYGVTQCRVCGIPIKLTTPRLRVEQEKANKNPPMPEAEWRRMGYLCPPTKRQMMRFRAEGCCDECGRREIVKYTTPGRRAARMFVLVFGFAIFATFVSIYIRH